MPLGPESSEPCLAAAANRVPSCAGACRCGGGVDGCCRGSGIASVGTSSAVVVAVEGLEEVAHDREGSGDYCEGGLGETPYDQREGIVYFGRFTVS